MDAAADYAAAKLALASHLPAYVSYTATTHAKFDAIVHDNEKQIVVRTSDGTVVKGASAPQPPYVQIGVDKPDADEPVADPALYVRVKGDGLMAWLLYDRRYENYRFSATEP